MWLTPSLNLSILFKEKFRVPGSCKKSHLVWNRKKNKNLGTSVVKTLLSFQSLISLNTEFCPFGTFSWIFIYKILNFSFLMFKMKPMKWKINFPDSNLWCLQKKDSVSQQQFYLVLYDGTEQTMPFTDQLGLQTAQDNSKLTSQDVLPFYSTRSRTSDLNFKLALPTSQKLGTMILLVLLRFNHCSSFFFACFSFLFFVFCFFYRVS